MRLQGALKEARADIKWAGAQNMHLTLKFLGDAEAPKIEEIKKVLDEVSSENGPFEISLFKLGAFPGLDRPRVIWIGVDAGCAEVEKLAKFIEEKIENLGFPKNQSPINAHITLGRVKSGKNKAPLKEKLLSTEAEPKSCKVKSITLFQSSLTPQGAVHTAVHIAELKGR